MFIVTLGTGVTFEADYAAEESSPRRASDGKVRLQLALSKEGTDKTVDWYLDAIEASGAKDNITVRTEDGIVVYESGGHPLELVNISVIAQHDGRKSMYIRLERYTSEE